MVPIAMENHGVLKPVAEGHWVVNERTQPCFLEFAHDRFHMGDSEPLKEGVPVVSAS